MNNKSHLPAALAAAALAAAWMLIAVSPTALAALDVTRDEAIRITTDTLPGRTLDGVRLYILPETVQPGTVISTWKKDVFTTPAEGWFLFVDLMPGANWEHPCRYIFVEKASGVFHSYDAQVPPRLQPQLEEITHGRDNPPPGESEKAQAWLHKRLQEVPKPNLPDRGRAFAFIISGGANQSNNHIRYWNDCSFIYTCLVEYYGYLDENIYVCMSDGTNPAPDRSDGTNSPPDLDGDGDDDTQYPATMQYLTQVFAELATVLTPSDQLFIFTTDHGGLESGWDCYQNLWNWEEMRDDQLAAFVNPLPCETLICTFEQCYSGGMIDDLQGDGRIISTACRYDQVSWAMGPNYIYDAYVYHWTAAVNWEDPYGVQVDADTNDDGVVSMREAFLYAEAHDMESEDPQYSSTPADLGDSITLYGVMEGVYLAMEDITFDDDMIGASHGDGDGLVDYNETFEVTITLGNMGTEEGIDVRGTLASASPYVTFVEDEASFGNIPPDGTGTNATPFIFHVAHDVPDNEPLALTLTVTEDPGVMAIPVSVNAPEYAVGITDIDDSAGDGDGIADPGETVVLTFYIQNVGGCETPDLDLTLGSGSSYFIPDETPHSLGVIAMGQGVSEGGFNVEISTQCPEIYTNYLRLHFWGEDQYHRMLPLVFSVGQIFADNMEAGSASWSHYAGQGTWLDEWHLDAYRNHTPGGTTSWKLGGTGAAQYSNLVYGLLETEAFDLPSSSRLTFWHWCEAETSNAYAGYAYDGGLLQISTDGGASWNSLTPDGGYPFRVRPGGTPGPFAAETPIWSGRHGWREVSVDLSAYTGPAKLRWAFGSDGATTREGWYVDDVQISTAPPSGADENEARVIVPRLLSARPNPVVMNGGEGGVVLRFALPAPAVADLSVYDATGRFVSKLFAGPANAGEHEVAWNARDAAGHAVPAGSYYYRLMLGDQLLSGRLAVIR